tara:strand:+ start:2037 stop:3203 length:1167 start_codon:yes stop_codon:yes gene_type:complete
MKVRADFLFSIVAMLLCLDSALKINAAGIYLQAGLLVALVSFILLMLSRDYLMLPVLRRDRGLILICGVIVLHSYMAHDIFVYLRMLFYMLMFYVVYIFVSLSVSAADLKKVSFYCILILCITGILQYGSTNFGGGFQLRGMDAEYYLKNGDLAYRMRGFFLEPNWFGIVLSSWFYIYFRSVSNYRSFDFLFLFVLTLLCLILSGNRLILLFFCAIFFLSLLHGKGWVGYFRLPMLVLLLAAFLFWMLALFGGFEDRSAAARLYTAHQILSIVGDSSFTELVFGYGFSTWGEYSNLLEFSWSNYTFDQELTRRDNSELYVVLFEMGLLGVFIYAYDAYTLTSKRKANILDRYFLVFVYISSFVYPMYTFMMYMMPYMIVRASLVKEEV